MSRVPKINYLYCKPHTISKSLIFKGFNLESKQFRPFILTLPAHFKPPNYKFTMMQITKKGKELELTLILPSRIERAH